MKPIMKATDFADAFDRIANNVNQVIHGKDDVVRLSLTAVCANGHVLFEDVPGVGKSMLARALAVSLGCEMARVQSTPDMLPGDITGSAVIEPKTMQFSFRKGPVFTNILLVDEINRSTPKTQSALLESMAERNVTVDGTTHHLPEPFLVLATQNPVEQAGTFPLPEAQLDRFLFRLSMGYPDAEAELLIMRGNVHTLEVDKAEAVSSVEEILGMQEFAARQVTMAEPIERYIIEIGQATRSDPSLILGAGPRAAISMAKAARVIAASDGRDRVIPEDVNALLRPILGHRLLLNPDAILRGESTDDVLDRVVGRIQPPLGVKPSSDPAPARRRSAPVEGNGSAPVNTAGEQPASADSPRRRRRQIKASSPG